MKYAPPIGQEAQGEEAHYVDGNPELGILGSPVPAAAIEQGQRELLHVIKQAGLTPSSEDLTQLFQAIGKLISNKVPIASKETAGIVKPGAGLQIGEDGTLDVLVSAVLPGTVVAFAGSFGGAGNRHPIPRGSSEPDTSWVLCDGGSDGKGGTVPNLLGRMILGASDTYKAGSTGGSEKHSHGLSQHCRRHDLGERGADAVIPIRSIRALMAILRKPKAVRTPVNKRLMQQADRNPIAIPGGNLTMLQNLPSYYVLSLYYAPHNKGEGVVRR